jgi:hypothetical protein
MFDSSPTPPLRKSKTLRGYLIKIVHACGVIDTACTKIGDLKIRISSRIRSRILKRLRVPGRIVG